MLIYSWCVENKLISSQSFAVNVLLRFNVKNPYTDTEFWVTYSSLLFILFFFFSFFCSALLLLFFCSLLIRFNRSFRLDEMSMIFFLAFLRKRKTSTVAKKRIRRGRSRWKTLTVIEAWEKVGLCNVIFSPATTNLIGCGIR